MATFFRQQITLFFYALSYFTRLPIPSAVVFDNKEFHKANAYFPIIGAINALVMVILFLFCQFLFSVPISILITLIGSVLLTGALHEDGFADCCDGLGGGYEVTQRLKIMKDSQIGSYGGIALVLLFLLKYTLLVELAQVEFTYLIIALFSAHILSRYACLFLMQTMPYVRLQGEGKVQVLSTKLNRPYLIFSFVPVLPVIFSHSTANALLLVVTGMGITLSLRHLLMKNIEGYTGDCLGFTQQIVEIAIFLLLVASLSK